MSRGSKARFSMAEAGHGMNTVANGLVNRHREICAESEISPMDYCVALCNAAAWILADQSDMTDPVCLSRISDLHRVTRAALRERRHGQAVLLKFRN